MTFKRGDRVALKSGGAKMTVQQIYPDGTVHCTWFENGKCLLGAFAITSIKKAVPLTVEIIEEEIG